MEIRSVFYGRSRLQYVVDQEIKKLKASSPGSSRGSASPMTPVLLMNVCYRSVKHCMYVHIYNGQLIVVLYGVAFSLRGVLH
jgi:hypothetical protein